MTVFYRMCGIPSTNPSPIFQENKYRLNKLCLKSFVEAFREVNPKVVFILDYCSGDYKAMIESIVPFEKELQFTALGINETALLQFELAKEISDDVILFQESDYFYRPNTGMRFYNAIKELGFVSPYDHLNFYLDPSIHSQTPTLKLVDNYHYRDTERNTLSFGIKADIFKEHYDIFERHGYLDNENFFEMRVEGHPLYVPIPSFATHMVKDYLAPGVDWKELYK